MSRFFWWMFCTRNVDGEIYVYVNMHVGTVVNMYCVSSSLIAKICRSHAFSNTVVESKEETHLDLMGNLFQRVKQAKKARSESTTWLGYAISRL